MFKIIVTGANGQLGQEIKRISQTVSDTEFVYTDIDTLDLSNKDLVRKFIVDNSPDMLINCAAYTAVDKAETEIEAAALVNAKVPQLLGQFAEELNYKLIHISTDYVFSGESFRPLSEDYPTDPKSVYGKTKLEGEKLAASNTDAVIIRTSWLYSVFGNNFVKTMIRLGSERDELGVVADQVGTPTNAADLARAITEIIGQYKENRTWLPGIYHFSNEGVCSWYDFALQIMEFADVTCNVRPIKTEEYPVPAPRPFYSVLDKSKIRNAYNIRIPHWKETLIEAIKTIQEPK